ncbi:MAG TPA: crosslink repair DNA glycosylase YcaQ family protein, partial [Micromonosporaceae bacterium]
METLSIDQARRLALASQGFNDPRPAGAITARHLARVISRIGLIQIDSVNVLQRAHYLPLYSRLGPYPTDLLDRAAYRKPRRLFEFWGHEASFLPVELYPLMKWRMERDHQWPGVERIARERPELIDWIREEVRVNGPITAGEMEADVPRPTGNWGWNWSDVKVVLEWMFWRGEVLVSARNSGFARLYDLPERVLPPQVLATPMLDDAAANRELVRLASRAMGVATEV